MTDIRPIHLQVKELVNDMKDRVITDTDIDRLIVLIKEQSK